MVPFVFVLVDVGYAFCFHKKKIQLQQENVRINKKLIEILKIWLEMVSNLVIFLLYALFNTINSIEHYVYKMQIKLTLFERVVLIFFIVYY